MRMAELAERSGIPVATIKYYRREGLLPPGAPSAPNQATYDDSHLRRLRLIRVLREVADLPVAAIADVLAAVDDPGAPVHEVVGAAHRALAPPDDVADDGDRARAAAIVAGAGWQVAPTAPALSTLGRALSALDAFGVDTSPEVLERYVGAADAIAAAEVSAAMGDRGRSRDDLVAGAVLGTVLYEVVLTSLRRLAQEHHSASAT